MEEFLSPEENNKYVDVSKIVGLSQVKDDAASRARNQYSNEDARIRRQIAASEEANRAAAEKRRKDEEDQRQAQAQASNEPREIKGDPLPNPLLNYSNYTYSLSLHIIPIAKYNKLVQEPNFYYVNDDETVLIASGGRSGSSFQRHPRFKEDFFFENLKFVTVVGLNSRSRNSNAMDINFTLIEPYGFSLINRMMAIANEFKTKNWMQIPFMLQIDFFGNNDAGDIMHPIQDQTKYLPVKLIGIKSKISIRGAEYQVQCIPYNHWALQDTSAATPAMFEVTAKTIKEFFSSSGAGEAANILQVQNANKERQEQIAREITEAKKKDEKNPRIAELEKESTSLNRDVSATSYKVGSYAAAINSYQAQLKTNNHIKQADEYRFIFDPEFADSKIVVPKKTVSTRTPMLTLGTANGISAIRQKAGLPVTGTDTTTEVFSINAGTSMLEVITMAMKSSEFIRKQFPDPATEPMDPQKQANKQNEDKPITWFKIVPIITIKDYDEKRDTYARIITYHVQAHKVWNTKFPNAPQSQPTYSVKEYNYVYTGQNESILSFDIDFDVMFYTAVTADRAKVQIDRTQTQEKQNNKDNAPGDSRPVTVASNVIVPVAGQADQQNPASVDSKDVLVNDFSKSLMSSSRGDMINVKLKIVGDPQLIKQDDVYKNPINNPSKIEDKNLPVDKKTNSILYDKSEVFALLTFRTPIDFSEDTGLSTFEQTDYSVFSGVYKIITVDNEFNRGQFTQNLDLVRLTKQPIWDTKIAERIREDVLVREKLKKQMSPGSLAANLLTQYFDDYIQLPEAPAPIKANFESNDELLLTAPANNEPVDEFGNLDAAIAQQEQLNLGEFAGLDAAVARQRELSDLGEFAGIDQAIADQQAQLRNDILTAETVTTTVDLNEI